MNAMSEVPATVMKNLPENAVATLFYFSTADELKNFERFWVLKTQQTHGGDSVPMWAVTGYDRTSGQNTVIAEFSAKGNAETFRDMSEIVAAS